MDLYSERQKGIPFDKESSSIFENLSRSPHNSTVHPDNDRLAKQVYIIIYIIGVYIPRTKTFYSTFSVFCLFTDVYDLIGIVYSRVL